ncbi:kinase-like protein [Agrocybe pediades]|nr:kinase-like protein [Agrocybe pediades]
MDSSKSHLSSLKSLARWKTRVTSEYNRLSSFSTWWDPASKDQIPPQNLSAESPVHAFCVSFSSGSRDGVATDSLYGTTLLVVFALNTKLGTLKLLGFACIRASYSIPETAPRRITYEFSKTPPADLRYTNSLLLFTFTLLLDLTFVPQDSPRTKLFLTFPGSSYSFKNLFTFLRYSYPKCLPASRKVILDTDVYNITHVGKGAFAVISRVLHKPTGETRVMKRITLDQKGLAKYLATNETDTLKAMKGNHWFPELLNDFCDGAEYVITMPFYQRGDLSGLVEQKGYLGRDLARFYSAQLILAIHSLHKKGIIHRDIKTDNIFLDAQGHLILADFGLAENIATFEGGEEMIVKGYTAWVQARDQGGDDFPFLWVNHLNPLETIGGAGTYWYTAPEVFRKEPYSFGIDYWSVGVIYHELITGHIPFNYFKPYPENKRPMLDFRTKPGQLKDILPYEEEALTKLLKPRPEDRPKTLSEIKQSPIFNGVDWEKMRRREIAPPLLPPPLLED